MNRRSFGKAFLLAIGGAVAAPVIKHVPAALDVEMSVALKKIAMDATRVSGISAEEAFERLTEGIKKQNEAIARLGRSSELATWNTGELVTAAEWNTDVVENLTGVECGPEHINCRCRYWVFGKEGVRLGETTVLGF
jgi:hypothetical protein